MTERNFALKNGETTADLTIKDLDAAEVSNLATIEAEALAAAQKGAAAESEAARPQHARRATEGR